MEDIYEKCRECGDEFVITVDDQNFYKEKDFTLPKRCKSCRKLRRQRVIGKEDGYNG